MSLPDGRHLAFPFRIGSDGRSASPASFDEHVKQEMLQLILTNVGERINLPEFGGDVRRLVFENIDDAMRGAAKARLTRNLNQWLGHRATLENLEIRFEDATFEVTLKYRIAGTEDSRIMKFKRSHL